MGYWAIGLQVPDPVRAAYMRLVEKYETSQAQLVSKILIELEKRPELIAECLEKSPPRRRRSERRRPSSAWTEPLIPIPVSPERTSTHKQKEWKDSMLEVRQQRAEKAWKNPGTFLVRAAYQEQREWFQVLTAEAKPLAESRLQLWRATRREILAKWVSDRGALCEGLRAAMKATTATGLFRVDRMRRSLEEFDREHRINERPLVRLFCDYTEARLLGKPLDLTPNPTPEELYWAIREDEPEEPVSEQVGASAVTEAPVQDKEDKEDKDRIVRGLEKLRQDAELGGTALERFQKKQALAAAKKKAEQQP